MTATEIMRRMLDERGVEYETCDTTFNGVSATFWHDRDGYPCAAISGTDDIPDGEVSVQAPVTPEQAIAATLGAGTCRNESEYPQMFFYCSKCGCAHKRNRAYVDMPRFCPKCGRKVVGA